MDVGRRPSVEARLHSSQSEDKTMATPRRCPFCAKANVPSGGTCPHCGTTIPKNARRKPATPGADRQRASSSATDRRYHGMSRDDV